MSRSHAPSLTTIVRRTLVSECQVGAGDSLLVAVSGGSDSTALLHALTLVAGKLRIRLAACGVDHGLRVDAPRELDRIEGQCREWKVSFERVELKLSLGGNLQARARTARYAALREVQSRMGFRYLVTAHQQLDRAETVLMRLLRGAPPGGLAVLPPKSDDLLRPMVRASKDCVRLHLQRHAVTHSEDPSNGDARFLRVRIRCEVIPLLETLSPNVVAHLCTLADEVGQGPLPTLLDEYGRELRLGQAQRTQLRNAARDRSGRARVLLKGGQHARLVQKNARVDATSGPVDSPSKSMKPATKKPQKG